MVCPEYHDRKDFQSVNERVWFLISILESVENGFEFQLFSDCVCKKRPEFFALPGCERNWLSPRKANQYTQSAFPFCEAVGRKYFQGKLR